MFISLHLQKCHQKYLYRTKDGKTKAERLSPANQPGTHNYNVSPTGQFAFHSFTNFYTQGATEWISLPDHKALNGTSAVDEAIAKADKSASPVEFFKVKSSEGVEMDAWMVKPTGFDASKKYPVYFMCTLNPGTKCKR